MPDLEWINQSENDEHCRATIRYTQGTTDCFTEYFSRSGRRTWIEIYNSPASAKAAVSKYVGYKTKWKETSLLNNNTIHPDLHANVIERREILKQLGVLNDLSEECLNTGDLERYKKVERDFNDYAERIEYIGKRS